MYNLCVTLFFISCSINCLQDLVLVIYWLKKWTKKQSLSTEKWDQIVTLSNLKFFVRPISKKVKISKTAVHNAIMKYQNEGFSLTEKGLANQGLHQQRTLPYA